MEQKKVYVTLSEIDKRTLFGIIKTVTSILERHFYKNDDGFCRLQNDDDFCRLHRLYDDVIEPNDERTSENSFGQCLYQIISSVTKILGNDDDAIYVDEAEIIVYLDIIRMAIFNKDISYYNGLEMSSKLVSDLKWLRETAKK